MTNRRTQRCKPLSGDFHVEFIEQRPSYGAGFAPYVTRSAPAATHYSEFRESQMSSLRLVIAIIGLTTVSACNYSASSSSGSGSASSSSSSSAGANEEITLSGTNGVAELAGDKVELKEGAVFVNGVSFGAVPSGAIVKYTKNTDGRTLFVGTERRSVQK
ncbi:MAG: hypothetical protein HXX19_14415 [Rhodoferax sp.]|nr:hypothetical protein [Rhodoferax sp.]